MSPKPDPIPPLWKERKIGKNKEEREGERERKREGERERGIEGGREEGRREGRNMELHLLPVQHEYTSVCVSQVRCTHIHLVSTMSHNN